MLHINDIDRVFTPSVVRVANDIELAQAHVSYRPARDIDMTMVRAARTRALGNAIDRAYEVPHGLFTPKQLLDQALDLVKRRRAARLSLVAHKKALAEARAAFAGADAEIVMEGAVAA